MEAMANRRLLAAAFLLLAGRLPAQTPEPPVKSFALNTDAGMSLDLQGRYEDARKYLDRAIKAARTDPEKAKARRTMAISYAFTADCKGAEKFSRQAFDYYLSVNDFFDAGETANELGRICIESGDLAKASDWYDRGHETGLQEPDIKDARADVWAFRWYHAKARLAVRQGKPEEARKLVARAKAVLDKGRIPEQQPYFPYLAGYVAFHSGDFKAALSELEGALQDDPFILSLTGQCHEKLGDPASARRFYEKAASLQVHSVPAAFGRTYAVARLAAFLAERIERR